MMRHDYESQFNKKPVSELEAYCRMEGVSLFSIRMPVRSKNDTNKQRNAELTLWSVLKKWVNRLSAVLKKVIYVCLYCSSLGV